MRHKRKMRANNAGHHSPGASISAALFDQMIVKCIIPEYGMDILNVIMACFILIILVFTVLPIATLFYFFCPFSVCLYLGIIFLK